MSNSLWLHGLQHAKLLCPSLSPRTCSNSCASSQWCNSTISSSVVPFSSCPQSFPASGSFPTSWLFTSGGQTIGASASASVLPMNIQGLVFNKNHFISYLFFSKCLFSIPCFYLFFQQMTYSSTIGEKDGSFQVDTPSTTCHWILCLCLYPSFYSGRCFCPLLGGNFFHLFFICTSLCFFLICFCSTFHLYKSPPIHLVSQTRNLGVILVSISFLRALCA